MTFPATDDFATGFRYGQFFVQRAREVKELRCRLIELIHEPSNARIIHIQNDDPENLFCLSFQTLPYSSNGIAHVLEHLVLCGSDKFSVRDPFFAMTRRSINTFMNALTSTDSTCYPASSQIEQDFYNLLDVYLDAVFHPRLDPLSFLQEAHRIEFSEKDNPLSPLAINGVVYNEMKGALVKPMHRLMKQICASLFPNTPYGFDSGGDPLYIPSLTIEEVKAFHQTYYHPSRALFFFYGSFPLARHLDVIERTVLHSAKAMPPNPPIPYQQRFSRPVDIAIEYPVAHGESLEKKAYISFGWLTADLQNQLDCLALCILDIVLLETDASLLKYRLLQSGHCRQVSSSCDTEMPQVPFIILLTGCEKEDESPLFSIIFSVFEEVSRNGLPMEQIENALHQLELAKSEIGTGEGPFGLALYYRAALLAHYGEDPIRGLEIHSLFNQLREALSSDPLFYSKLIQKYFLQNPHCVRIVMTPNPTFEEREKEHESQRLEEVHSHLDEAACQRLIKQAKDLAAFQEQEQELECLPSIHLKDIPKHCRHIDLKHESIGNVELFSHETFTNDIVYLDVVTPLPKIPREDLWLVRLFTALLPQLGCGNRTYQETLEYLQAHTGGVYAGLSLNSQASDPLRICPSWHVMGKALGRNAEALGRILFDFLNAPRFDDRGRIQELLEKRYTDLENTLSNNALDYASSIASSSLSEPLHISEGWHGLSFFHQLKDLVKNYTEREDKFLEKLKAIQDALLCNQGMHVVACADSDAMLFLKGQQLFGLCDLPARHFHPWESEGGFSESAVCQGYAISSSVSFTAAAVNAACYASADAPGLSILAQLMNDIFLHHHLRELGGAYGGGASFKAMAGIFSFYSYKDPNLFSTLQSYENALQFIYQGSFDERALEEAKLGVFQDIDSPVSPGGRASLAYSWWRSGRSEQMRQHFRDLLMQARREDIQALIPRYFPKGLQHAPFVAFAGKDLLEKERYLFEKSGKSIEILTP